MFKKPTRPFTSTMKLPRSGDHSTGSFISQNEMGGFSNVLVTLDKSENIIQCQPLSCEYGHLTSSQIVTVQKNNSTEQKGKNISNLLWNGPSFSPGMFITYIFQKHLLKKKQTVQCHKIKLQKFILHHNLSVWSYLTFVPYAQVKVQSYWFCFLFQHTLST